MAISSFAFGFSCIWRTMESFCLIESLFLLLLNFSVISSGLNLFKSYSRSSSEDTPALPLSSMDSSSDAGAAACPFCLLFFLFFFEGFSAESLDLSFLFLFLEFSVPFATFPLSFLYSSFLALFSSSVINFFSILARFFSTDLMALFSLANTSFFMRFFSDEANHTMQRSRRFLHSVVRSSASKASHRGQILACSERINAS
mmetsp:Transcript_9571/g.35475  ORF Transcript_9571/g.35475 Transcript_9571/m.35475 type:complete len:201 (-) Transcript_9571:333-935(-)